MADEKRYRASTTGIEWKAAKYDTFKLVKTIHPYRCQKGSGRQQIIDLAKDGMLVGTWTKKVAEAGWEPVFATNSIQKLMTTEKPGWVFSETNAEGKTYEEVKGTRGSKPKAEAKAPKAPKAPKARKGRKTEPPVHPNA